MHSGYPLPSNPAESDFSYGYQANTVALLATVTGPVHTVTNTWETTRNVLDPKSNDLNSSGTLSAYDYTVNAIGQRTNVSQDGTAFATSSQIDWTYDALGQVTSADHSAGPKDRAYAYDSIGNRKHSEIANTQISVPAVAGTTSYAVNSVNAYTAVSRAIAPKYDGDGNATAYPLPTCPNDDSILRWDAENRLISVRWPDKDDSIEYSYDYLGRRIECQELGNQSPNSATVYLYDGWNCVAEYLTGRSLNGPTSFGIRKSYLWGLDLSGSLQGAGGVGGLLTQLDHAANDPTQVAVHYPTYDGNGNVSEYLSETGTIVEHNEYDPFGNLTSGGNVSSFTYRFSTKPLDPLTGLYYYGYRYYDPVTGRWPSRDPIEEEGGVNLYGFVGNDGLAKWDYLGMLTCSDGECCVDNKCEPCSEEDDDSDIFEELNSPNPVVILAKKKMTKGTAKKKLKQFGQDLADGLTTGAGYLMPRYVSEALTVMGPDYVKVFKCLHLKSLFQIGNVCDQRHPNYAANKKQCEAIHEFYVKFCVDRVKNK